jgi:hypothetical protein
MVKKTFFVQLLIILFVFGSCTTQKQVICPTQDQSEHLARKTTKAAKKGSKSVTYHLARKGNNTANIFYKSRNVKLVKPVLPHDAVIAEMQHLPATNGFIDYENNVDEDVIASTSGNLNDSHNDLTGVVTSNRRVNNQSDDVQIDLGDKRDQRRVKREINKELRRNLRIAAQDDAQQGNVKQAMPLAIASLVLGITSFVIFAIPAGTLAIVFGAVALTRIKKNPSLPGRGMAIAGLVCGIVGVGLYLLLLAALF